MITFAVKASSRLTGVTTEPSWLVSIDSGPRVLAMTADTP
jgi:hypothetical protein